MSAPEDEKAFANAMTQVFHRAKREAGYTATRFAQMLGEHGAVRTAKMLLHAKVVSEGFSALWEAKRLDLTVEYLVLRPEFRDLFDDDELAIARARLLDFGLDINQLPEGVSAVASADVKSTRATPTERPPRSADADADTTVDEISDATIGAFVHSDALIEISTRRNAIEAEMRKVLSQGLRFSHGGKAAAKLLSCLSENRRTALVGKGYEEMWDELFFGELRDVVGKEWAAFSGWFGTDKDKVLGWLDHVNRFRADAHARNISEEDLAYLRVCFRRLEESLDLV